MLILTFLNRCISVKTRLINTKLGDFVNLGVLFLTVGITIYRLVPSPSWFGNIYSEYTGAQTLNDSENISATQIGHHIAGASLELLDVTWFFEIGSPILMMSGHSAPSGHALFMTS